MPKDQFRFRQFTVRQDRCLMKVGTDGVLLGAWADVSGAEAILDIGAGTGLIALMVAQRAPDARVDAVELDPDSAVQASENAAASPWAGRVRVFSGSIQDFAAQATGRYDCILSNPPFFSAALRSPHKGRNQVRHDDSLPFSDLLRAVDRLLSDGGHFCVILPYAESKAFEALALRFHLFLTRIQQVASRPGKPVERVMMQLERHARPLRREPVLLLHHDGSNERSEAYRELTSGFYLG
jgi:tRNA1Val (adenine37-N6)-methyltransferase